MSQIGGGGADKGGQQNTTSLQTSPAVSPTCVLRVREKTNDANDQWFEIKSLRTCSSKSKQHHNTAAWGAWTSGRHWRVTL